MSPGLVPLPMGPVWLGVPTQIPIKLITGCPRTLGYLRPGARRLRGRSEVTQQGKRIQVILLAACGCEMNKGHPSVEGQRHRGSAP